MNKKLLATAAVALVWAGAAQAADPIIYEQPLMSPQPIAQFDWSGFYVGANAGYGGGTFEHPFAIDDVIGDFDLIGSLDISAGGGLAGVQAGYNMQFNQWVAGVETDIQWSGIKGELAAGATFTAPGAPTFGLAGGTEVEWFGTLRARLGYTPVDRFLVYGTGGLAYGRVNSYYEGDLGGAFGDSTSDTEWGWTVGAGVEYAFTDRLSMKTEYLYTDLGERTLFDGTVFGEDVSIGSDVKFHTVRAGLNFHF